MNMSDDEVLVKAGIAIAVHGRASAPFVQRALGVTFEEASAAIRRLETANIIGPVNLAGTRAVLVKTDIELPPSRGL